MPQAGIIRGIQLNRSDWGEYKDMDNMDARQLRLVIGLLAAVVLFVTIRFGYSPVLEKADVVSLENQELEGKLAMLRADESNKDTLDKQLKASQAEIELIEKRYPSLITPEKSIKFVRDMEVSTGAKVKTISFNDPENIYTSSFTNEDGESILGYLAPLSIAYEAGYDEFKAIVNYINGYGERMNVKELTASYNQETGVLTGTMLINRFSITGLGKEYEPPAIGGIKISTDNIFGAVR